MLPMFPFFWLFPIGLFQFVLSDDAYERLAMVRVSPPLVGGWIMYAALTVLAVSVSRRVPYWLLFSMLCLLLALNVTGCYCGMSRLHFE